MLMDDELNILPISSHVRDGLKPVPVKEDGTPDIPGSGESAAELKELVESLSDVQVSLDGRQARILLGVARIVRAISCIFCCSHRKLL